MGNGWYNPLPIKMFGRNFREHLPIGQPQFIARLNINYTDGTTQTIVSDESGKHMKVRSFATVFISVKFMMPARRLKDWDCFRL